MKTLERNIINLHGEVGKQWLQSLPAIVKKLSELWQLTNIVPVKNMSWNFVVLAKQNNILPVVLKISCDSELIQNEYKTLKHFDCRGSIRAIDINTEYNALLLEQAIPGYLLKSHHPIKIEDTINIYAHVVNLLSAHELSDTNYTHAKKWCNAIDRIHDPRIPVQFLEKAKQLRSLLFNKTQREYLCHGDLHLENIIQQGSNWVIIDPKGIIGEMAFEAAAFDLISKDEMKDVSTISSKLLDRMTQLSEALEISFERLSSWIFLRIIISAQWFIEDNGDPNQMLTLASYVYPLLDVSIDGAATFY